MAWGEIAVTVVGACAALGGVALGGWQSLRQARENRKAFERAERSRMAGQALADAQVLLTHANAMRFTTSFDRELSPQLLADYKAEAATVERVLAHAAVFTSGELRDLLRKLNLAIAGVLHWLAWATFDMTRDRVQTDGIRNAHAAHDDAMTVLEQATAAWDAVTET
jgi:hypothetical protein